MRRIEIERGTIEGDTDTLLKAAQAEILRLVADRNLWRAKEDEARRNANNRDRKWMEGIESVCGCKIDFMPPMREISMTPQPPSLDEFIRGLKAERDHLRQSVKDRNSAITNLNDEAAQHQGIIVKLQKFKTYVHTRLDEMGVPKDPPAQEGETADCRIGRRLRWLHQQRDAALHAKPELTDDLVERCAIAQWDAVPYHVPAVKYMEVNPEGWKGHLRFIRVGLEAVLKP